MRKRFGGGYLQAWHSSSEAETPPEHTSQAFGPATAAAGLRLSVINSNNTMKGFATVFKSALRYLSYGAEWIRALFVIRGGGYNVYHIMHKFSKTNGGGEAEKLVGRILAIRYARQVEFLPEDSTKGGKADLGFDEMTWEVKNISLAKSDDTIRNAIRDAAKADNVIFWWESGSSRLGTLKRAVSREIGHTKKTGKNIPDIYYLNADNIIQVLYKKSSEPSSKGDSDLGAVRGKSNPSRSALQR